LASLARDLAIAGSGNSLKSIREELLDIPASDPSWRFRTAENRITTARVAEV
jgi:hypothetical protein